MPVPSPYAAALAAIPVREAAVEVLGSRTRYWEYGPRDRPVDLVLVHGYRGDHHGMEPIVSHLPGLRIVSPDLPGFGASTPTSGTHSISGYAAWLGRFLDALDLTGTTLLGHSFGSIVVSHAIAAGVPSPRLVLVNPIAADAMSGASRALVPLTRLYFRIGRVLPERAAHLWLGNRLATFGMSLMLARTKDRRLRRWIHEEHDRYFGRFSDPTTLAEGYDASLSTNVLAAAPALTMPTLIVAGDADSIAPLEGARELARRLPHVELVVLHDVGHLIHYERPAEAAEAIRHFLEAHA